MKPYLLVLHNKIRFFFKKMTVNGFRTEGISMLSRHTKLTFGKDCDIFFGDRIVNDGRMVVIVDSGARLSIGKSVYFNEDAMISCKGSVLIEDGCQFGPNVKIFDNNHKFDASHGVSSQHSVGNVRIGENCWIGANAVILKNVTIGRNSVIGAGCVVSRDIPESSVVTQSRELVIQKMRQ